MTQRQVTAGVDPNLTTLVRVPSVTIYISTEQLKIVPRKTRTSIPPSSILPGTFQGIPQADAPQACGDSNDAGARPPTDIILELRRRSSVIGLETSSLIP
jgi:hypothetical protein